eukprot:scaffold2088_cov399-Prasinococcus_capsulatus_cf.AAC.54
MATISPAFASSMSSISSECIRTNLGTLIFLPFATFMNTSPRLNVPEYILMYVSCPYRPSSSLKASATDAREGSIGKMTLSCTKQYMTHSRLNSTHERTMARPTSSLV